MNIPDSLGLGEVLCIFVAFLWNYFNRSVSKALFVSGLVSVLLLYNDQSLQARKAQELQSLHCRKDQPVELMLMPQDGAGHFIGTGPWSLYLLALYVPWLNPFPAGSLLWKSALAGCMGIHKRAGISAMLDNRVSCFILSWCCFAVVHPKMLSWHVSKAFILLWKSLPD